MLPAVPGGVAGLAALSEGLVALLSVELAAPLSPDLPAALWPEAFSAAFSAELEEDAVVPDEALAEGIAGTWALLRAAQPASQEQARIVTTADARLPIWCIPLRTS